MAFISIPDAFRQTMEELGVKGIALATATGCSGGHISEFKRGGDVSLTMLNKLLDGGEACAPGFKVRFASHWLSDDANTVFNDMNVLQAMSKSKNSEGSEVDVALKILQNRVLTDDQIAKGLMILSIQLRKTVQKKPDQTPDIMPDAMPDKEPAMVA